MFNGPYMIDLDYLVPKFSVRLEERRGSVPAGIVDQKPHGSEIAADLRNRRVDCGTVADIDGIHANLCTFGGFRRFFGYIRLQIE